MRLFILITEIKKDKDLEEKLLGREGKVDEVKMFKSTKEYSNLFSDYKKLMSSAMEGHEVSSRYLNEYVQVTHERITPAEIQIFHDLFAEECENIEKFSVFLTNLIQNNYNAGNNNFEFTILDNLSSYCIRLIGSEYDPLIIKVNGNMSTNAFFECTNVDLHCLGNVYEYLGFQAYDSKFLIEGDAVDVGQIATNCTFILHGNIGIRPGEKAKDCIFKAKNMEDVKLLHKDVNNGNHVYFIDADGKDHLIRDEWGGQDDDMGYDRIKKLLSH